MRHFIEKHAEAVAKGTTAEKAPGFVIENVSRRSVLGGILASSGLVLSLKMLAPTEAEAVTLYPHGGLGMPHGVIMDPKVFVSIDKDGTPTYENFVGSGFMIVIEAKPGMSNIEVGRRLLSYTANDPKARPDLEIESTHDLGDGSPAVCDRRKPDIGGIPGIIMASSAQWFASLPSGSAQWRV